ncbi:hypothetical protein U9M48_002407 [Paspalum notatum var. saurae]|uniref:Uncharacterized protein n=1 Tax=Paspalum notatum var. saurae TaxID=547442 RepID=A0AAQ3PQU9_PASNO
MADSANGNPSADDVQEQERRREEEAKAAEERRLKEPHDKEVEDRRRTDLDNPVAHMAPAEPFLNTQGEIPPSLSPPWIYMNTMISFVEPASGRPRA